MVVAIRISLALAVIVPAYVWGLLTPWWQTLAITFVGFAFAEGVAAWVRKGSRRRRTVVLGVSVVALGVSTGIAWATRPVVGDPIHYYREVESVVADDLEGEVRVHGVVQAGSVRLESDAYDFVLEHGGESIAVHADGVPPELFREEGEVIVEGALTRDGRSRRLRARQVMTPVPRF
jgi:cytochrome c-type biogenesis protein CcmE